MRSYPGGREADADLRKQLGSVHQLSARAGAPGSEGVTTDDLIARLTAIADNPEVGAAAKIRAIEVFTGSSATRSRAPTLPSASGTSYGRGAWRRRNERRA